VQVLEAELARINGTYAQVEQKLKLVEKERGKEVDGLQDELISAQHSLDEQRQRLEEAEAKYNSGQLNQENKGLSIDSMKVKLTQMCGVDLCLTNLLQQECLCEGYLFLDATGCFVQGGSSVCRAGQISESDGSARAEVR
jgi:response regulator RpfG family c-di-GMP phosphodiesterase